MSARLILLGLAEWGYATFSCASTGGPRDWHQRRVQLGGRSESLAATKQLPRRVDASNTPLCSEHWALKIRLQRPPRESAEM